MSFKTSVLFFCLDNLSIYVSRGVKVSYYYCVTVSERNGNKHTTKGNKKPKRKNLKYGKKTGKTDINNQKISNKMAVSTYLSIIT